MSANTRLFAAAACSAGIVALASLGIRQNRAAPLPQVNGPIVIVSVDTLRADHVSAYGSRRASTPAIDGLAADGVLFERAYSHAPQTLPAHASILTGLLPYRHGVRDNVGFTLAAGPPTLAELLHGAGIRSAAFVSAYVLRPETGIARGFDEYDARFPPSVEASMGSLRRDGAETVAAATQWLDRQPDGRFLLFVHLYEPHRPWRLPQPFASTGGYGGAVSYADALVGRLLDALHTRGLYDRSLIVLLADHGEGLGTHGEEEHGVFLYDEAVHVPLIVKLPGARRAGRRIRDVVQHVDLLPTLLDVSGVPLPGGLDGVSLRPLLDGAAGTARARPVYAEGLYARHHFGWSELYSMTDDRFRFILAPSPELYDLRDDPGETRNLAAQRPAAVSAMSRALRAATGRSTDTRVAVSTEELERFRALGYVGTAGATTRTGDAIDPKNEIEWLERYRTGVRLASERRFEEAEHTLRSVVARHPEMVDVWTLLGHTALRAGHDEAGIEALERAIALDPSSTETILAVAVAQLRNGLVDRAAAHARLVLDRNPAEAHQLLARVALARGKPDEARAEARRAQRADPRLPLPAFIEGMLLYQAGRFEEAAPFLERAANGLESRRLSIRDLHFTLGDTLAHLGRSEEAEQAFRNELALFPGSSRARTSLALLYAAQGRARDAARALDEVIETTPTPESYSLVARTYQVLGDRSSARTTVERGLRAFPSSAELQRMKGVR